MLLCAQLLIYGIFYIHAGADMRRGGEGGVMGGKCTTVTSKCFEYQFLATLYERGKEVQALGIKERGERVADVTRIIT